VKCRAFGFSCDYRFPAQDFQLSVETVSNIAVGMQKSAQMVEELNLDMINAQLRLGPQRYMKVSEVHQLNVDDLAMLNTFQNKTVLTIGTDQTMLMYRNEIVRLACQVSIVCPDLVVNANPVFKAPFHDAHGAWDGMYAYKDSQPISIKREDTSRSLPLVQSDCSFQRKIEHGYIFRGPRCALGNSSPPGCINDFGLRGNSS
jgi:hypothetical protein